MTTNSKTSRILTAALLALCFAGSGFTTIGTALNVDVARPVWIAGWMAAALSGLMAFSGITAVIALIALGLFSGGWMLSHAAQLRAIPVFFGAWQGQSAQSAQVTSGCEALLICGAMLFGLLFFLLLYKPGLSGLAIMLLSSMLIFSHGMSQNASIMAAVPGLVAAAVAFSGQESFPPNALRVLIPSALAVALALMLLPQGRVTWAPMEDLANRVRSVFEQYFNFTHERIAFSIAEEGYNHGGEIQGQPVAMLGGPANPDPNPVMKVTADGDLLLRGTIRSTYTGYSWIDVTPKNRYLYYDVTHAGVRDRVFNVNMNPEGGFLAVKGEVELIDSATSTLFVPGRLQAFDMDLSSAVYYNSAGEMFMARNARRGDRYAVTAMNPDFSDRLRELTLMGESENDPQYESILAAHSQLPSAVEPALIQLTQTLCADSLCAYDRAMAILSYLRGNMRYRLDVPYPPQGRDFASWFVLEAKEGYCSYFATAMAVMGRIAGLPTRYVEGYSARSRGAEITLTGIDAHAWAEIYFKGLGWISFDATGGGPGNGEGAGGEAQYGYGSDGSQTEDTPFEDTSDSFDGETEGEASLPPEEEEDQGDQDNSEDNSEEDSEDQPEDSENDTPPEEESQDETSEDDNPRNTPWFLIPLLLLLLLILAGLWVYRRLKASDPMALCAHTRRAQQGALIAYRANLTLLLHMGQAPRSGESPDAFVHRLCQELNNPDYEDFVKAFSLNRYAGHPLRKEDVERGLRAYRRFLRAMRPVERLRFTLTRITRGLGDFEQIP